MRSDELFEWIRARARQAQRAGVRVVAQQHGLYALTKNPVHLLRAVVHANAFGVPAPPGVTAARVRAARAAVRRAAHRPGPDLEGQADTDERDLHFADAVRYLDRERHRFRRRPPLSAIFTVVAEGVHPLPPRHGTVHEFVSPATVMKVYYRFRHLTAAGFDEGY